jgi:hypothetical protein
VKVIYLRSLVAKLELDGLVLQSVRIEYIECEMTAFSTKWNNPINVLDAIQTCSSVWPIHIG